VHCGGQDEFSVLAADPPLPFPILPGYSVALSGVTWVVLLGRFLGKGF
jgi:hypothetical protein